MIDMTSTTVLPGAAAPEYPGLRLATTYEAHHPALLEGVLPYVDYLEITPDALARRHKGKTEIHPDTLLDLHRVRDQVRFIVHGVGLSIGSWDGYSEDYADLLGELLAQVPVDWHSEHLGYIRVGNENINTMLAVPRTCEMLALITERIRALQRRFEKPFLLENIMHLLPDTAADYSDAEFLNALCGETGCGLILDLYNLECDVHNYGFDLEAFFRALDFSHVRELHIAGGVEHKGFKLDIHSSHVADSTMALTERALEWAVNARALTYEILPEAVTVHGHAFVVEELARIADYFKIYKNAYRPNASGGDLRPAEIPAPAC